MLARLLNVATCTENCRQDCFEILERLKVVTGLAKVTLAHIVTALGVTPNKQTCVKPLYHQRTLRLQRHHSNLHGITSNPLSDPPNALLFQVSLFRL